MEELVRTLKRNNFTVHLAENSYKAKELAMSLIPVGSKIGMGNSLTLRETGIYDALVNGDYDLVNQFEAGISAEENLKRRKQSLLTDIFFSSSNAITRDGELINIDGKGNRVAAMMFGPDKVIIVVGKNKIVADENEGWQRLRQYVAPALAKRLNRPTPCVKVGICQDCDSPQRICRCYTVIRSQMAADQDRINIIIVNEDLGL